MPYLTPDEIPEEGVCRPLLIPDDTAWLALVSGALTELTQPYNWEQFGAVTVEQAVERMQAMVDAYYAGACGSCELPDGGKVIQIRLDGRFYEQCGDSWCEPTGDYEIPPVPAREGATDDQLRCLAAKNAANVLEQLYEQVVDNFNEHISAAETILQLGIFIGTLIAPPIGLAARSLLAIFAIGMGELFAFLDFLTEDVWDENFTDKLVCMLLECSAITDGVVTFNYECLVQRINDTTNPFDFTFTEYRLLAQVNFLLTTISIDGLNLAGATTAITDDDCEYCAISCHIFDASEDGDFLDWWTLIEGEQTENAIYGEVISGSLRRLQVSIEPLETVTSMQVYFNFQFGNTNANIYLVNDDTSTVVWGYGYLQSNPIIPAGVISFNTPVAAGTSLRLVLACNNAYPLITGVQFCQDGPDPYEGA